MAMTDDQTAALFDVLGRLVDTIAALHPRSDEVAALQADLAALAADVLGTPA